jgi:hypothetical protein
VNELEADLLSISVFGILALVAIIAVMIYFKLRTPKVEPAMPRIEREILDEVKALREDLRIKPETPTSIEIKGSPPEGDSRFKDSSTLANLQLEIEKLRQDFVLRFGAKFSKQEFTADDAYPFFLAVSNALSRFESERERGTGSNSIIEAKGYVAILHLILSWAQANGDEGVKRKAEEFLVAANSALESASHL